MIIIHRCMTHYYRDEYDPRFLITFSNNQPMSKTRQYEKRDARESQINRSCKVNTVFKHRKIVERRVDDKE